MKRASLWAGYPGGTGRRGSPRAPVELRGRSVARLRPSRAPPGTAAAGFGQLQSQLPEARSRRAWEALDLAVVAQLIARPLAREESRGAQYRLDYPAHNDARFMKHSVIVGDKVRFE